MGRGRGESIDRDGGGGAGVDYTTIQAAVDAASEGDTIEVRSGAYVENVDVNKTLALVGEGADVVTVRAASSYDHVFEVTADYVNISGFTATGATSWPNAGIRLISVDHCNIFDNNCSDNSYGIWLDSSSSNTLLDNNCSNNYRGTYLRSSSGNTIYHNNLIDNADHNAYDFRTNQWDSGSEGNYYSDYTGDTQYDIPGGTSIDRFPLMQPWTPPQKGDLNHGGNITPADAAIALEIAVGSRPCDAATLAAADVNDDGSVTSLDALMILQAAAGAIEL